MKASERCTELIKRYEGLSLKPYLCPAGKWTIGYGHTKGVSATTPPITANQAEEMLAEQIQQFADGVRPLVKVPVTQDQFDALVSYAYNRGLGAFQRSTVLAHLNSGDYQRAAEAFFDDNERYRQKKWGGLIRRRNDERALFQGTWVA